MTRLLSILALAALVAVPGTDAQARPTRTPAQPGAAIRARQSAMNDFAARMSRLDTLMGVPSAWSARVARSRSAEAGR